MVYTVSIERMEIAGEGYARKSIGIGVLVWALLLRLGPVRHAAERTLRAWSTQLRSDDPCLACGTPLADAPAQPGGLRKCVKCEAVWRVGAKTGAAERS